jgi:hypothetical protein
MLWDVFPVATLLAILIGPFLLGYLGHPLLGLVLPASYLLLIVLLADEESPNYDMPGFGTTLLLVGCFIAAVAWTGGVVAGLIHRHIRSRREAPE